MYSLLSLRAHHPQLVDLVALLTSYGVLHEISPLLQHVGPAGEPAPCADAPLRKAGAKFRHPPRFAVDGTLILNARQRRTLRRAQDRAARAIATALSRTDQHTDDGSAASVHSRQGSSDSSSQPSRPPAEVLQLQALPGTTMAHVASLVAPHLPPLTAPAPPANGGGSAHKQRVSRFAPGQHPRGADRGVAQDTLQVRNWILCAHEAIIGSLSIVRHSIPCS